MGLAVLITASPTARAGKLGKANDRIQGSTSNSKSSSSSSSSSSSRRDDDDEPPDYDSSSSGGWGGDSSSSSSSDAEATLAALCLLALPWCVPYLALETGPDRDWAYEPYPYAAGPDRGYIYRPPVELPYRPETDTDGAAGALDGEPFSVARDTRDTATQLWSFRPSAEASYVFDNILRTRVAGRFLTPSRLELGGALSFFVEQDGGKVNTAMLGRVGLSGRFAQSENAQFRTGISILHWNYEGDTANGAAGSYGFDFFPGKPVIGSVDVLLGGLGQALFFELRGTLGVSLGRAEVYAGYDFTSIDDVYFGGPLMGVRLWL